AHGQSTENRVARRFFVEVEGLWIEFGSERPGPLFVDAQLSRAEGLPSREVFEIPLAHLEPAPVLDDGFERKRNALPAADAQSDDAPFEIVAAHRMNETCGEDGAGCADRVAVRDGAAFDVDDVLG